MMRKREYKKMEKISQKLDFIITPDLEDELIGEVKVYNYNDPTELDKNLNMDAKKYTSKDLYYSEHPENYIYATISSGRTYSRTEAAMIIANHSQHKLKATIHANNTVMLIFKIKEKCSNWINEETKIPQEKTYRFQVSFDGYASELIRVRSTEIESARAMVKDRISNHFKKNRIQSIEFCAIED